MSALTLYNAPQSTCSQRVRFILNAKGLAFEEHKLDLFTGDQLKPDYLKLNPNGVVPTLVHDGNVIIDSAVILQYVDEVFPDGSGLVPEDPVKRAHMRSLMAYIDEMPTPAVRIPSYNLAFVTHFRDMDEEEFIALANSKPLRKEFLLKMGRTGFPEKDMNEALDRLQRAVDRVQAETEKSGGPWLLGKTMTLADIMIMPVLVRLDDLNLQHMWQDKPNVPRWLEAIRAQPAFKPTYYHGSLLTEKYPHLAEKLAS